MLQNFGLNIKTAERIDPVEKGNKLNRILSHHSNSSNTETFKPVNKNIKTKRNYSQIKHLDSYNRSEHSNSFIEDGRLQNTEKIRFKTKI